ncbi:hypothetical protein T09_11986 [Trichinella sp. T9]|nr:hypothetical protein T09_11986 [Trichinella sp. T9]
MQKLLETCCKLQGSLELGTESKSCSEHAIFLKTSSDLQFLMCFIAKIEKALSIAYVVARG